MVQQEAEVVQLQDEVVAQSEIPSPELIMSVPISVMIPHQNHFDQVLKINNTDLL